MADEVQGRVLLELAFSLGGEPELPALLARTLPLVLHRTGCVYVGLVRRDGDGRGPRTELVVPRVMGHRDEWTRIVAAAFEAHPSGDGPLTLRMGEEHVYVFDLPGVGVLILGRREPFDPWFASELGRFADVLTRACLAGIEQERRRAIESELVEVQDRQRALLDNLPFAAWMTDASGRLTLVNDPFARTAGCAPAAAIGRTLGDVLGDGLGQAALAVTNAALESRRPVTREHDHPPGAVTVVDDGQPDPVPPDRRTVEHHAGPVTARSGRVLGATGYLRDVTARVTAERELQHQARFQRLLIDLAVGFVNVPLDELDDAIERALAETGRFTGVDRTYLFAYDLDAGTASNTHEWCAPGVRPQRDQLQDVPMAELAEWLETHQRGEVMHVPRVSERPGDDPIRQMLEAQDVETVIAVPLIDGDRCLGFVGFDAVGAGRTWATEELALLDVLAELFTNALVRTEREDAMRAARREAEAARERLGLALSATRDAVFDHDVASGRVHVSPRWWAMVGADDGPTETDLETLAAQLHPDDVEATVAHYVAALRGSRSTLRLEFRLRHRDGHEVPVLNRSRILRDADGHATRVVGSNLDVTDRKRREAAAQRQLELESTLATVSARFVGLDAFDAALDAALGDVGRLCGAHRAFLATADAEGRPGRADHVWHAAHVDAADLPAPTLPDVPWLEQRLRAGETVHLPGRDGDGGGARPAAVPSTTGLVVPLLVGGELVGVLGLEHVGAQQPWNDADVTAVRAVAEVVAGALARARSEAELRANEREHRRTVEHLLEVVFRTDEHGRWSYLNPVWEELTGWPVAESLGTPAAACFHPDDQRRLLTAARGTADQGVSRGEFRLLTRSGAVRWVEIVVQPDLDEHGRMTGIVGSFNDVTDRRESERALVEAKQAAEAASDAKTRFISTVSHELRTPMNGVTGMLDLLLDQPLPERAAGYARAARRSASSLLTLVDDLLDIAKIEAGRLELEQRPLLTRGLVEEVREVVAAAAAQRGNELRVAVEDTVPEAVVGDAGRLRQILVNLLGNAVKFTEQGRVMLEVSRSGPDREGRVPLAFTVSDTGTGIDPELVPVLFDAFTQADQSTTRRFGGTGLGLAIVRQLTELMDGRIRVESTPGGGSTFRLDLELGLTAATPAVTEPSTATAPPEPSRARAAVAPHATTGGGRGAGHRVLVIEDNDINQALARAHLEDLGCEVTVVSDGAQGARSVRAGDFDLVLMDCLMPGVDGFEATRRIRAAEEPGRHTPVVALTANATEEHATACRRVGMDDVLAKPYRRDDLAALLDRFGATGAPAATGEGSSGTGLVRSADGRAHPEPSAGAAPVDIPISGDAVFDPQPLEALGRDVADPELIGRVVRTYADRAPDLAQRLTAAIDAGDDAATRTNSHALMSSSASVGAVLVERLAQRIVSGGADTATQAALGAELREAVVRTVAAHSRYLEQGRSR